MTTKKIMVTPWALTQAFQACLSASIGEYWVPGPASWRRVSMDIATATKPAKSEKR